MRLLSRISILLIAILLGFSSCGDEPDGKWDKMKWNNLSNLKQEEGKYIVPASGGTYTFECTNYKAPWINSVTEEGVDEYSLIEVTDNFHTFIGKWFDVRCVNADLVVTIDPLDADCYERNMTVIVTAGDIFEIFVFQQQRLQ
jgi:hypothetical protein